MIKKESVITISRRSGRHSSAVGGGKIDERYQRERASLRSLWRQVGKNLETIATQANAGLKHLAAKNGEVDTFQGSLYVKRQKGVLEGLRNCKGKGG